MLARIEKWISAGEECIVFLSIISSVCLVFLNICLRYLFGGGYSFVEEYARYSMILLVYAGVSQAIKKDAMIKVDILSHYMPNVKIAFDLASNLISLAVAVILVWAGLQFTTWQYSTGQTSVAMDLPMWIAYGIVPTGGLLMILRYTVSTVTILRGLFRKPATVLDPLDCVG